ncbi:MAG TPA: VanZ family protein [Gemmatimonadaceae bacterium]
MSPTQRRLAIMWLVVSAIAIAVLTLTPEPGTNTISFWCLKCGTRRGVDVLLNILLFTPLGIGLGLYYVRPRTAALIALGSTCFIETAQFLIPGRDASLRDILMNFVGGVLGYYIGRYWRTALKPSRPAARILAVGATILWFATQLFSSWAMQIAPPRTPWWAQMRPERDDYPAYFKDKLVAMSLGSLSIEYSDELEDSTAEVLRNQMPEGTPFRVSITDVDTTRPLSAIAIISAGPVHDVVWWAADGRDAVFGTTVRGTLLGLRTPSVRIKGVMPESRGDTVELAGWYRRGWYQLQARDRNGYRHRDLRASPSWGWAFVIPFPLYAFGAGVMWLTALYLLGVWVVLGCWYARSVDSSQMFVAIAGMSFGIILGLAVAPILYGLPIARWSEWLAAIAGGSVGWIFGTMNRNVR